MTAAAAGPCMSAAWRRKQLAAAENVRPALSLDLRVGVAANDQHLPTRPQQVLQYREVPRQRPGKRGWVPQVVVCAVYGSNSKPNQLSGQTIIERIARREAVGASASDEERGAHEGAEGGTVGRTVIDEIGLGGELGELLECEVVLGVVFDRGVRTVYKKTIWKTVILQGPPSSFV